MESACCASTFNSSAPSRASKSYRKPPLDVALHTRIRAPKLFCIPLLPLPPPIPQGSFLVADARSRYISSLAILVIAKLYILL